MIQRRRSGFRRGVRLVGIAVIVAGILGGVAAFVLGFLEQRSAVQDLARGPLPSAELVLEKGDFTIFAEGRGLTDERGSGDTSECIHCSAVHASTSPRVTDEDGRNVPVEDFGFTSSYDIGGHEGVAIGTVSIPEAGAYVVDVETSFTARDITHVAVGEYSTAQIFVIVGIGLGIVFAGLLLGGILVVIGGRG